MIITNFNEFQNDCRLLGWDEYVTQKEIERRLDEEYDEKDFNCEINGANFEFILVDQSIWSTAEGEKSYNELNDDDWDWRPEEIRGAKYEYKGIKK